MRTPARTIALGASGALGVALGALLGPWDPGWGLAAAFPLFCGALAAGVIRDPDGPEIHVFLAVAMAFTLALTITSAAFEHAEIERALERADGDRIEAMRAAAALVRADSWPKWIVMGAGAPIGAVALGVRARALRRRARTGRGSTA